MPVMLERWNDDKMDALSDRVDALSDRVDERFEQVDRRFEQVDRRFEQFNTELRELRLDTKAGFERTQRMLVQGLFGLSAVYMTGIFGLIGALVTQL